MNRGPIGPRALPRQAVADLFMGQFPRRYWGSLGGAALNQEGGSRELLWARDRVDRSWAAAAGQHGLKRRRISRNGSAAMARWSSCAESPSGRPIAHEAPATARVETRQI